MACNLLSRYVRQNGAAAVDLGLGINKGEPAGGLWIFRLLFRALILSGGRSEFVRFFFFWFLRGEVGITCEICVHVWIFGRFGVDFWGRRGCSNRGVQLSDLTLTMILSVCLCFS
jgi:hypothetical protein